MQNEFLDTALEAARAGAAELRRRWGRRLDITSKQPFDYATDADLASEEAVKGVIARRHPDHAILAEESAGDLAGAREAAGPLWIVDPLDGTTNYIHGIPHVAVSVGVAVDGALAAGVVLDVTRGEEFSAAAGQGAWLDGRPLRAADAPSPEQRLLLTGFPFRDKDALDAYLGLFKELFSQISGVRRAGTAALDLVYVAAGRAQGFWELGLKPWDMAAGILIVREAGGVVTDFGGGDNALWRGDLAAAAPGCHQWLQETCARWFPHLAG